MDLSFALVGFDRETEELAVGYPVPKAAVGDVLKMVNPDRKPIHDLGDDIPVTPAMAKKIGVLIHRRIPTEGLEFFVEVSGPPRAPLTHRSRADHA
ncbi:MAG TPA: hypothetical protein VGM17_14710 [Rhizomicrobium sp.]|jgi:hypothetical protein